MQPPPPFDQLAGSAFSPRRLSGSETLFRQGQLTKGLYFLESGCIEMRRVTETGDPVVVHSAKPGETFAEASLFSRTYHCDAVALTDSVVFLVRKQAILDRFASDPQFGLAVAGRFADQIQFCRRKLELAAIRDAKERIFAAISDGMLNSSIKSFAAEIGLTHETAYRALAALVRDRKLKKTGRGTYLICRENG